MLYSHIIELGAGMGLAGLALALVGAWCVLLLLLGGCCGCVGGLQAAAGVFGVDVQT
jgi:hypothetical protein